MKIGRGIPSQGIHAVIAQDSSRTYRPIRTRYPTIRVEPSALQTVLFQFLSYSAGLAGKPFDKATRGQPHSSDHAPAWIEVGMAGKKAANVKKKPAKARSKASRPH